MAFKTVLYSQNVGFENLKLGFNMTILVSFGFKLRGEAGTGALSYLRKLGLPCITGQTYEHLPCVKYIVVVESLRKTKNLMLFIIDFMFINSSLGHAL